MQSDFSQMMNLSEHGEDRFIAVGLDFATILSSSFCSCTLFAIFLMRLTKLEFLAAASWAEMADVEQMKNIIPFSHVKLLLVKMSASWRFGINVSNLNF